MTRTSSALVLALLTGGISGSGCGASGTQTPTPPSLGPVSALNAFVVGSDVSLHWKNPSSAALVGVRIQRRADAFPSAPSDGTTVFDALAESCTDAGLPDGTYYYAAFAHDATPVYAGAATAKAIVEPGSSTAPWAAVGQVSAVSYDGALWAFAARGDASDAPGYVWRSVDGAAWSAVTSTAPWGAYAAPAVVVLGSKLWVLGGVGQWDGATRPSKDVWWSPDGATWTLATDSAPLDGSVVAVHAAQLWILSGLGVHASADGTTWPTLTGRVPWRSVHAAWSWKDRLWVAAVPPGGDGNVDFLWWSPDGTTWTRMSGTYMPSAVAAGVYRNQAVLLPGRAGPSNDVLFSVDGASWKRFAGSRPWSARSGEAVVFTDDRIWILGGQAGGATLTDVWSFDARLGCEGSGAGNDSPTVKLRADPPAGNAPHRVVLSADASDPNCDRLTYVWDFGDGTKAADPLAAVHVYAAGGSYTAKVTASDGQLTATDSVTVEVAPRPQAAVSIGAAGGTVSIGNAEVTVPPVVGAPDSLFTLTQLPSNAGAAASMLPADRFVLIGSSYRLDTEVSSADPLVVTLSWSDADIPPGYDPANLAVVFRGVDRVDTAPSIGPSDDAAFLVSYVALPVAPDLAAHRATFELHGRGEFQLAACSEPLSVYTQGALLPSGLLTSLRATGDTLDRVKVVFNASPEIDRELFRAAALSGFHAADDYAKALGFVVVPEMITIAVADLGRTVLGSVNPGVRWLINLDRSMTDPDQISKVTAHEYFHTVQAMASNHASDLIEKTDDWWWEGTACWFMDQVPQLDSIPGGYHATTLDRLAVPLNAWKGNDREYQTVGFWKWLEAKRPGAMQRIMNRRLLGKHSFSVGLLGVFLVDNQDATAQLVYVIPELANPDTGIVLDYLDFAQDVIHRKTFDMAETGAGELWGRAPQLGPSDDILVASGDPPAPSADESVDVRYSLQPHLSVYGAMHYDVEDSGRLHVLFGQTGPEQHYTALVRIFAWGDPATVRAETVVNDLSTAPQEVVFDNFDNTSAALVIVVDAEWSKPDMIVNEDTGASSEPPARQGAYRIWLEAEGTIVCPPGQVPCGSACADLRNDPNHCGWCTSPCGPGATCTDRTCTCPPGLTWCGGDIGCVDVATDPRNCGGCQGNCGTATCNGGSCVCPEGQSYCGGPVAGCFDLMSDPANCGQCGRNCTGAVGCVGGRCQCADPKLTWCDGACVDTQTDELNCGRCGNQCLARCPGTPSACEWGTCFIHAEYWCGECGQGCTRDQWCQQPTSSNPEWHCEPCYSWQHRCAMDNACCSYRCCPAPDTGAEHCWQAVCP